jgi:hypothetical protein
MCERDIVRPFDPNAADLLRPFESTEQTPIIQERVQRELSALPDSVKRIKEPAEYPIEFVGFSI